ncbi:smad fha domain-containing protein [Lichtheimia corymbifera JMRC:FSU:9682]|uniref:Smad fha domain-containing protein n=1 Tax=Lichtheimia corymbifera JMRC:FSU:9682 TaxID=1263082 RepID=A0A068S9Z4_9FUNG|nr:smad fha domain-containing protein [Lichtheimia corymbifera JMRC:FSU:9682]
MVHIRLVPHVSHGKPCHVFDVVERDMSQGTVLKLGRCAAATVPTTGGSSDPRSCLIFRSKVVSRHHAELWSDGSKLYIRDIGSSSGTFVNHLRLSPPRKQSKSQQVVHDGDVIQLGIDYQKGIEPAFRAVRMRVEIMPCSPDKTRTFSKAVFERLHHITTTTSSPESQEEQDEDECCICLCPIASSQALFVAPCAHIYHYKCMRPAMEQHFPAFSCPICRAYCDLNEDVDDECSMMPTTTSNGYKIKRHMSSSSSKHNHRNARHFKTLSPHVHAAALSSTKIAMLPTHSNSLDRQVPPPHIQLRPYHAIVA